MYCIIETGDVLGLGGKENKMKGSFSFFLIQGIICTPLLGFIFSSVKSLVVISDVL
ncbi:hypothetical protein T190130A13A_40234 [Tenacibaculum sp. 190130A14a]|uniref:Uncharacterized protein n=1 Tax=Tenacibaculum polynesiense TaxID=3137857 RepID=A0ABM9PDY7_9FLAO